MTRIALPEALDALEASFGPFEPPRTIDPWLMILWENLAYLADDDGRQKALDKLRAKVGTEPDAILAASTGTLSSITANGILPELGVEKLRNCARIALEGFDGDLNSVLKRPLKEAKKALMKFPSIGEPGAEKILLFGGAASLLALESNGLRVLVRLGFAEEQKSYSTTYRLVQDAVRPEIERSTQWLVRAHQLLRRHGQTVCRRSKPQCDRCPLVEDCDYAQAAASQRS
jgi:endonuclease III